MKPTYCFNVSGGTSQSKIKPRKKDTKRHKKKKYEKSLDSVTPDEDDDVFEVVSDKIKLIKPAKRKRKNSNVVMNKIRNTWRRLRSTSDSEENVPQIVNEVHIGVLIINL